MGEGSFFPTGEGGTLTETQQAPGTPTTSDSSPGTPTRTQVAGGTPTAADTSFTPTTPSQDQDIHVASGSIVTDNGVLTLRLLLTNDVPINIPVTGLIGPEGPRGIPGTPGMSITGDPGRGIQSFTATTPSTGQATTLTVTFTDGTTQDFVIASGVQGQMGTPGTNGISVTSATVDGSGDLIVTLSDNTTVNAGNVVGAQGNSITSVAGTKTGETVTLDITIENSDTQQVTFTVPDGTQGPAGVSVTSGAVNTQNELVLTLSDGSTVNVGNVRGPTGPQGADSTVPGPAGRGINSIDRSQTGNTVTLTFNYSDGSTEAETFSTVASIPQDSVSVTFSGGSRELSVTVDGATDSVVIPAATETLDVQFNDATNDLTVTVDGVSDTANIPNTIIPPTTVDTLFNESTRVLTTIVDGVNSTVTIPGGGTPGTPTEGTTLKELRSTDALIAEELRYSPDNKLYRTVAFGTFLMETHKTQQTQTQVSTDPFMIDGIDIDLAKGDLDLGDYPNGFQLGA